MSSRVDSLQYGGRVFRTASSFLRRVVPGSPVDDRRTGRLPLIAGPAATALLLAGLPKLSVSLTDSPAGARLREHFSDRMLGILHSRLMQGVLVLPEEQSEYLRGRSRQALRTSIHKARAAGIVCRRLEQLDQRRAATVELRARISDMLQWGDELFCFPGDEWWSARAPSGETVALAQVTVDREWAMLQSFASTDHAARCLLHTELVNMLIAKRVRYLAVDASMAPLLEPSLQYWQRLLGFRVVNLLVHRTPLASVEPPAVAEPAAAEPGPAVEPAPTVEPGWNDGELIAPAGERLEQKGTPEPHRVRALQS